MAVILDTLLPASGTITPLGAFMWLGLALIAVRSVSLMIQVLLSMFSTDNESSEWKGEEFSGEEFSDDDLGGITREEIRRLRFLFNSEGDDYYEYKSKLEDKYGIDVGRYRYSPSERIAIRLGLK